MRILYLRVYRNIFCDIIDFIAKRNKLKLTSAKGDVTEVRFADSIRAGNEKRINAILQTNWPNIGSYLLAQLSFDLTLDRDTSLDQFATDEPDGGVPDVDKVTMTVTAFQLGIWHLCWP